LYKGALGSF